MDYQNKKYRQYRQCGICAQKNSTVQVAKTSSDLYIYDSPSFIMTTADKINQNELTFDLSGISYNSLYTATTNCFTTNLLSGACFDSISWYTNIYENGDLVNSNEFFSSTGLTGSIPTIDNFSGSVISSFNTLGYTYEYSGSSYTITHPTNELSLDVSTKLNVINDCPLTGSSSGLTFTGSCEYTTNVFDLDFSGLTSGSTNVYIIDTQTGITMDFIFTGNTSRFYDDTNTKFKFQIFKRYDNLLQFREPPVYKSLLIDWTTLSATSSTTTTIPIDNLLLDGEYIVKGFFESNYNTEFASLLGIKNDSLDNKGGDKFALYDSLNDYHFVVIRKPEKPIVSLGVTSDTGAKAFSVASREMFPNQTSILLPNSFGEYIIALNGLVLAKNYDYIITGFTTGNVTTVIAELIEPAVDGDIVTIAYSNDDINNTLYVDTMDIQNAISSGTTNNQSTNSVYYNTTTNKYELYISLTPTSNNDIAITLNGSLLANNIDYYQSTSNPKRIILEGNLIIGDIINVYYNTTTNVQSSINIVSPLITWRVNNIPTGNNGVFTIQLSTDKSFTNIVYSSSTSYINGQAYYSDNIILTGGLGTKLYYRIRNQKEYKTILNDIIIINEFSEIIPIVVGTNATNNY
jgi:hypothetical protein